MQNKGTKKTIVIDGNSVVTRVRPDIGESYPDHLTNHTDFLVHTISRGHKLIEESARSLDSYVEYKPDVVVLNFGVNELCSRSLPRFIYEYLFFKVKRTHLGYFLEGSLKLIESKIRPILVNLRFRRSWYRLKRFESAYHELVEILLKYSDAQIICLGVNIPNSRIEKQLLGSTKRIKKWNQILHSKYQNIDRVEVLLTDQISEVNIPDGIHFNETGHREIYELLVRLIEN